LLSKRGGKQVNNKWYVENIPQVDPANNQYYSIKKNIKAISVIGIENLQPYFATVLKIYLDQNVYFCAIGNVVYFPDNRYVEQIAVNVLYFGGSEYPTKATIIYQTQEN
jgi:hypothetical protein